MRSPSQRRHILLKSRRMGGPMHSRERNHQPMIQLLELRPLLPYNIAHFPSILGGQAHAQVPGITEARDTLEEFGLGERLGESEQGGADGGGEVDLLREAHAGIVFDDADRFVHATS